MDYLYPPRIVLVIVLFCYCTNLFANNEFNILKKTLLQVKEQYIKELDTKQLVISSIQGMLNNLDNNSQYLSEDEFQRVIINTKGKYIGIGINIKQEQENNLRIISVTPNSPAEKHGITNNDIIISINGDKNLSLPKITKYIQQNQQIKMEILRGAEKMQYSIPTTDLSIQDITSKLLNKNILYIKIIRFNTNTDLHLQNEIQKKLADNITGIIIDLRDNTGGVFNQALSIAKMFLSKGKNIASIHNKNKTNTYKVTTNGDYSTIPLIVLINKKSASAAEIVTAALKENGRAIVVGEQSYGKGSVQTIVPLNQGYGAIKITTAMYHTPNGNNIDKIGIKPDIEIINDHQDRQLSKSIDLLKDYHKISTNNQSNK